jgi:DNA-directed RNA polymerase subunit omega
MELPQGMDSKFRYILVAAKRARQLQAGARPLIQTQSRKTTKVAQQEVQAGLVPIELPEPEPESNGGKKQKE